MMQYSVRIAEKKYLSFFKKWKGLEADILFYLELRAEREFFVTFVNGLGQGGRGVIVNCPGQNGGRGSILCSVLYIKDWYKKGA